MCRIAPTSLIILKVYQQVIVPGTKAFFSAFVAHVLYWITHIL